MDSLKGKKKERIKEIQGEIVHSMVVVRVKMSLFLQNVFCFCFLSILYSDIVFIYPSK